MENLNYLEKSTQPEITYVLYQCEQLYEDTIKTHGEAVERIGLYLMVTEKIGIYICPCNSDVKVWNYADFSSNLLPEESMVDSDMAHSR